MALRTLARTVGVVLVFAAILTSVTGFTASNTVPVTYAGKSGAQAATPVELAPTTCAALALTAKIVMTATATTVTGTSAAELIIGVDQTGNVSYNGGAGNDCIVAGGQSGTKNALDGGTGTNDICIGAPGARNTFKNCDQTVNRRHAAGCGFPAAGPQDPPRTGLRAAVSVTRNEPDDGGLQPDLPRAGRPRPRGVRDHLPVHPCEGPREADERRALEAA